MGRRALRKPDPKIDLSFHLLEDDQLPSPCTSQTLFDNERPIEIEIGSGKGLFMTNTATANPDHNFVGIEVAGKYCHFAASRLARAGLSNARMVHGDAMAIVRDRVPDRSVRAVHVYFPDPWWKKRHRKRRIMNEAFLMQVVRILEDQGQLHFWTDVDEYFEVSLDLIRERIPLSGPFEVEAREAAHHLDYQTHFERRMRMNDLPVYRSLFRKEANQMAEIA